MIRRWRAALTLAVAAGLLAACSSEINGPGPWQSPGALLIAGWLGNTPNAGAGDNLTWSPQREATDVAPPQVLIAPDTVNAGQAFELATYTVGPSGCWRADGQTVQVGGRLVVVKPFDAHSGSEVCTMALAFLEHRSTLVLYERGAWTLRVEGRRLRLGDDVWEEPVTAARQVVVR